MIGVKINIHYVGKGSKCITVLCEDLADMQRNISELSMKPGVERVVLNDYATIPLEEVLVDRQRK